VTASANCVPDRGTSAGRTRHSERKAAYRALQRSVRSALRHPATPAPGSRDDPFAPARTGVL
jgi:hypothetical protein